MRLINCDDLSIILRILSAKKPGFDEQLGDKKYNSAYKKREEIDKWVDELLEITDPFNVSFRDKLAQKLGLAYIEPINEYGLAIGTRADRNEGCFLVDATNEKILPVARPRDEDIVYYITPFKKGRALIFIRENDQSGRAQKDWTMIDERGELVMSQYKDLRVGIPENLIDGNFPLEVNLQNPVFGADGYLSTSYLNEKGEFFGNHKITNEARNIVPDYSFHDGVAWTVHGDTLKAMDESGNYLFELKYENYRKIYPFAGGFALIISFNSFPMLVSKTGETSSLFNRRIEADSIQTLPDARGFYLGKKFVDIVGTPVYMRADGRILIGDELGFFRAHPFSEDGLACVLIKRDGELFHTLINDKGEYPFPDLLSKQEQSIRFNGGIAVILTPKNKYQIINSQGKVLFETPANDKLINDFSEGYAVVETVKNDKPVGSYIINKYGRDILKGKRYIRINGFNGGVARLWEDKIIHCIDHRGKEVFQQEEEASEEES